MHDDSQPLPALPATPLGIYRHYKGGLYEVLGVARHSETLQPLVVYRPLRDAGDGSDGSAGSHSSGWWLRPHAMFFEQVNVDGRLQPRFLRLAGSP